MVFENDKIFVEVEPFEIPWLKIFAKRSCKEWSECDEVTKAEILKAIEIIERAMLAYFHPDKINIASFGNMLPQVHWHVQARFTNDSYFPDPVWGKKRREARLDLPDMEKFIEKVRKDLEEGL